MRETFSYLIALVIAQGVLAQPTLVKDINTTDLRGPFLFASEATRVGDVALFGFSDNIHGHELWRSDGTAGGTWMVKDICPGVCPSFPVELVAVGSTLYFTALEGAHGRELWKTDGTAAGTMLVHDGIPGIVGSQPISLFELDGHLLFAASTSEGGHALWITDGTAPGTRLLKLFCPEDCLIDTFPLARLGAAMMLGADDGAHQLALWRTDGTEAGTVLVKNVAPMTSSRFVPGYIHFALLAGRLYFSADDGTSGFELWSTDGTEAGTALVKDILPGAQGTQPTGLTVLEDQILFSASPRAGRLALWRTDGTAEGTVLVKDVAASELARAGATVYFRGLSQGLGAILLWKTDGTSEGTVLVKTIAPASTNTLLTLGFTPFGDSLLFLANDGTHGLEPWASDGTELGTVPLADLSSNDWPGFNGIDLRTVAGGLWNYRNLDADGSMEMFVSDGTPAGTRQLTEINHQASAFSTEPFLGRLSSAPANLNGTLLFQASDGVAGQELWKTDGTAAGTNLVADIVPGAGGSYLWSLTPLGSRALFRASSQSSQLWTSDGTPSGTSRFTFLEPSWLARAGNFVYLESGDSLYRTDGTSAGTAAIHGSPSIGQATPFGSLLLFASQGSGGFRLWRTDGSLPGTFELGAAEPARLTWVGSNAFFAARNDSAGNELWTTDGTVAGTVQVKDILPGPGSGIRIPDNPSTGPQVAWAGLDGRFVLFPADAGTGTGEELWISDGTATGTFQLADIHPGPSSSEIQWLTGAAHKAYFVANDGTHGRELWTTDGTPAGTHLVADLVAGEGSSLPEHLWPVGTQLLYSAFTPDGSRELWTTDGDAVGTRRLADIAPGVLPSTPQGFTASGKQVYFVATDAETGFELYSIPREQVDGSADFYTLTPCRLVDTRQSGGPLTPGLPRTVDAANTAGSCGIPSTAKALAVNVTAIGLAGQGGVALDRSGSAPPGTNTVSVSAGQIRAGSAMVRLGDGSFVAVASPETVSLHLVVDVSGYYE